MAKDAGCQVVMKIIRDIIAKTVRIQILIIKEVNALIHREKVMLARINTMRMEAIPVRTNTMSLGVVSVIINEKCMEVIQMRIDNKIKRERKTIMINKVEKSKIFTMKNQTRDLIKKAITISKVPQKTTKIIMVAEKNAELQTASKITIIISAKIVKQVIVTIFPVIANSQPNLHLAFTNKCKNMTITMAMKKDQKIYIKIHT